MPALKPINVEIRLVGGGSKIISTNLHRHRLLCVNYNPKHPRLYNLTHVGTGMAIVINQPKYVAVRMMELLGELRAWKEFTGQDSITPELSDRVWIALKTAVKEWQITQKAGELVKGAKVISNSREMMQ